jgi:hypothetical protein
VSEPWVVLTVDEIVETVERLSPMYTSGVDDGRAGYARELIPASVVGSTLVAIYRAGYERGASYRAQEIKRRNDSRWYEKEAS